ncbi:MAG: AraC family transcriptional regulator [Chitinophagaceae bacterium]|nr:AraC family transcriptional regulator [Chitinophagaceae bacterium]
MSLSIAAIALDCGYNDPGYFSRVFKQETGLTPRLAEPKTQIDKKVPGLLFCNNGPFLSGARVCHIQCWCTPFIDRF